jgi:hypothetical protein
MQLDLIDEESAVLLKELSNIIENDRYPLSARIRVLRGIRAKVAQRANAGATGQAADAKGARPDTTAALRPAPKVSGAQNMVNAHRPGGHGGCHVTF